MSEVKDRVSLAMAEVAKLHRRLDLPHVTDMGGVWEYQVDRVWWFAVNSSRRFHAPTTRDILVPPKSMVVTWRQFPVATVTRNGGDWVARHGVTEDEFIAAVRCVSKYE